MLSQISSIAFSFFEWEDWIRSSSGNNTFGDFMSEWREREAAEDNWSIRFVGIRQILRIPITVSVLNILGDWTISSAPVEWWMICGIDPQSSPAVISVGHFTAISGRRRVIEHYLCQRNILHDSAPHFFKQCDILLLVYHFVSVHAIIDWPSRSILVGYSHHVHGVIVFSVTVFGESLE